jgi:hypothetical protein
VVLAVIKLSLEWRQLLIDANANDIYMPLFPSTASSEAGLAADGNKVDTARQELMKLCKAKMSTQDF